ncbi:unnamed protein product [Callosobruchus maculatus]|uniref:Uncharacterized protein n=1 Tax=Callosobruchus maculatus TaxID=64391 RepID=A0A653D8Z8_CALMS|nr:unnamed protein product [Callosobruchus maculatus]
MDILNKRHRGTQLFQQSSKSFLLSTMEDIIKLNRITCPQALIDGSRRRITICSDSQAAIKVLSAWEITSGLVLEGSRRHLS